MKRVVRRFVVSDFTTNFVAIARSSNFARFTCTFREMASSAVFLFDCLHLERVLRVAIIYSLYRSSLVKSNSEISNGSKLVYRRRDRGTKRNNSGQMKSHVAKYLKIYAARLVYCQRCYARLHVSWSSLLQKFCEILRPFIQVFCLSIIFLLSLIDAFL